MTTAPDAQAPRPTPSGESPSIGDLLGDITRDLSTLMRQEVELAKAELRQSAKESGKGAGMLGAAGDLQAPFQNKAARQPRQA